MKFTYHMIGRCSACNRAFDERMHFDRDDKRGKDGIRFKCRCGKIGFYKLYEPGKAPEVRP